MKPARLQGSRDENHSEIVDRYEALGCTVQDLSSVGGGCPDLLVGGTSVKGRWDRLVEIKTESGTLERNQVRFWRDWRGRKPIVVRSAEDVYAHVKIERLGMETTEVDT